MQLLLLVETVLFFRRRCGDWKLLGSAGLRSLQGTCIGKVPTYPLTPWASKHVQFSEHVFAYLFA